MTVTLIQTQDPFRLDVAFHDTDTGPVEGYIMGSAGSYMPYRPDGLPLAIEPLDNPVLAASLVIDNFAEREVAVVDRQIADLKAQQARTDLPGYVARSLPRRIDSAYAYRERVLSGLVN